MQLTLRVNDRNIVRRAVESKGILGAIITLFAPANDPKWKGKGAVTFRLGFYPDAESGKRIPRDQVAWSNAVTLTP